MAEDAGARPGPDALPTPRAAATSPWTRTPVERRPAEVRVIGADDGVGFLVPEPWTGLAGTLQLGLIGMRERVALLGGELALESAPGSGTSTFARLPLPAGKGGPRHDRHQGVPGR